MLLLLFSLIDIAAGISLAFTNVLGLYLGIAEVIKGLSSFVGCLASKEVVFAALGLMDIVAGLVLIFGFSIPWLWLIVIVKGTFSLLSSFGG